MRPTTEESTPRYYHIQLAPVGGAWPPIITVEADILCDDGKEVKLKKSGHVVATITGKVSAWWVEDKPYYGDIRV